MEKENITLQGMKVLPMECIEQFVSWIVVWFIYAIIVSCSMLQYSVVAAYVGVEWE